MKKVTEKTLLARVNRLNGKLAMMEAKSDPAVLKIQQDLIAQGYPLKPDGIMGPKTKAAMDWQAKSNVRDAGLQATKNMDPNQPAPAVPTDPAKKAAYDAAIKNMDPNQNAPVASVQTVAQQPVPAAPPAPNQPPAQNPAVQDFTNKWLAAQDKQATPASSTPSVTPAQQQFKDMVTHASSDWHDYVQRGNAAPKQPPDSSDELADAAHAAFLKHDQTPQDIDLINRARTTLPSWQQPGVKSMFGEPPAQQGNAAAFQPKLGPDGKPLPVAGPNGETTWRKADYDTGDRPDIFGQDRRISSNGGVAGSKSMFENLELARIVELAKLK